MDVEVDRNGIIYVADRYNHLIRKVDLNGVVTTLAGSGLPGSDDGQGTAASFKEPWGLTVDSLGYVYVADTKNNKIRKISPTGLVSTIAGTGHETLGRAVSGYDLAQKVKSQIPSDAKIYSVRLLDHTVPFYLERNTIMVEFTDELTFGAKQEPQKWIPTLNEFVIVWNQDPNAFALMSPGQYEELKTIGLPMEELGRDSRRVVVRHPREALRQ
ncbi:MAG: hypothetical protein EBY94_09080 [Burkholderiaceae bacterium]|nr:hypothetical protein [Burkholderiaceae bacterium]